MNNVSGLRAWQALPSIGVNQILDAEDWVKDFAKNEQMNGPSSLPSG